MRGVHLAILFLCTSSLWGAEDHIGAVREGLQHLSIDKDATFRVRELELAKGGAKFYLSEGVLAFATPVDGKRIAAVYTIAPVEAGDAEVICLPPFSAERASLARFTKSPNLDEHFTSALLFFASNTADDLLRQIHEHPLHPAPDLALELGSQFNEPLQRSAAELEVRITQSILDRHRPENGFFYGMLAGRKLGLIDFMYQPEESDSLVFGRVSNRPDNGSESQASYFQIWSAFRQKNEAEMRPAYQLTDYKVDSTIHPDLSMTSSADFDYQADSDDGSVVLLFITTKFQVKSGTIDGEPAAVVLRNSPRTEEVRGAISFLLVSQKELEPGSHHRIRIQYEGSVVRRTANGSYFVDDRNAWYPFLTPMLTVFDLTFHCPEALRLVATGDPVSESVEAGIRTVRRRTPKAQTLAGFSVGEFQVVASEHPPYRIEICSNKQAGTAPDLDDQAARILKYFSARWTPLTGRSVSITPIEGYFGQGFPGLIYLSNISYLQEKDRPQGLRNASLNSFFSHLLLPHELAHQWWGNMVVPLDYRSNWIVEALSNYAALEYLEQDQGHAAIDDILAEYRQDLIRPRSNGELVDSYGPVTFDQRLENNFGAGIWHDVLYEKGTWILHMLRQKIGREGFHQLEINLLRDFSVRPVSNEDLRMEAAKFVPKDQPDRQLTSFFDTWVYDTGIPQLAIKGGILQVSGVSDSYTVDVPLSCGSPSVTKWIRANSGESPISGAHCSIPPTGSFLFR